jgi:hypothetical protein
MCSPAGSFFQLSGGRKNISIAIIICVSYCNPFGSSAIISYVAPKTRAIGGLFRTRTAASDASSSDDGSSSSNDSRALAAFLLFRISRVKYHNPLLAPTNDFDTVFLVIIIERQFIFRVLCDWRGHVDNAKIITVIVNYHNKFMSPIAID